MATVTVFDLPNDCALSKLSAVGKKNKALIQHPCFMSDCLALCGASKAGQAGKLLSAWRLFMCCKFSKGRKDY